MIKLQYPKKCMSPWYARLEHGNFVIFTSSDGVGKESTIAPGIYWNKIKGSKYILFTKFSETLWMFGCEDLRGGGDIYNYLI